MLISRLKFGVENAIKKICVVWGVNYNLKCVLIEFVITILSLIYFCNVYQKSLKLVLNVSINAFWHTIYIFDSYLFLFTRNL